MKKKRKHDPDKAWEIHFRAMCEVVDQATAMAVLLGFKKDMFLHICGSCYDYWHNLKGWEGIKDEESKVRRHGDLP